MRLCRQHGEWLPRDGPYLACGKMICGRCGRCCDSSSCLYCFACWRRSWRDRGCCERFRATMFSVLTERGSTHLVCVFWMRSMNSRSRTMLSISASVDGTVCSMSFTSHLVLHHSVPPNASKIELGPAVRILTADTNSGFEILTFP